MNRDDPPLEPKSTKGFTKDTHFEAVTEVEPASSSVPDKKWDGATKEPSKEAKTTADSAEPEDSAKKPKGLSGTRLVAVLAGVAVVALLAGIVLMRFIVSPAEVAARSEAPEAGPVTAVIEEKEIVNEVRIRGTINYADSVEVKLDTSSADGRPIVTGQVPEVGALLNAGNVALEVTGRPVLVLPGKLPAYRSLEIGMSGPDVTQLKQALASMGYDPGDLNSNYFEWQTSEAVGALYSAAGYTPSNGGKQAKADLQAAESSRRDAQRAVTAAEKANTEAYNAGQPTDETWQALQDAIELRDSADAALDEAQNAVQPRLPAGEVLFLESLPRRVDEVFVQRGGEVTTSAVMMVSGAELTIEGSANAKQAADLGPGDKAFYKSPSGAEMEATIKEIKSASDSSGAGTGKDGSDGSDGSGGDGSGDSRSKIIMDPGELTAEQVTELRGKNVMVAIPIAASDGAVLAVPIAALSASANGSDMVELLEPTKTDPFHTEMIPVKTLLSADGTVGIQSDDARIKSGARVVVGR